MDKVIEDKKNSIELDLGQTPGTPIDIASALIRSIEYEWRRKPLSFETVDYLDERIEADLECICDVLAADLRLRRAKKMSRPIRY